MHEDVRPFGCSFCDQTFSQKAHLQRHETTHGDGPLKSYSKRKNSSDDKSEDDMDEDGLRESKTTVTIQLDPTDTTNFQRSQYEVTELREEDIIEAVPGTTVVMTSAGAVVTNTGSTTTSSVHDAVAAAVNEAIKDMEYHSEAVENNVRVEAQPVATHSNMSPETLTAISGGSSPQSGNHGTSGNRDESSNMQDIFTGGNTKHN